MAVDLVPEIPHHGLLHADREHALQVVEHVLQEEDDEDVR